MPRIAPFERHAQRYDGWFEIHRAAYLSELLALRAFVPWTGHGIEIGVGSGRFAAPLGIALGVDPSPSMRAIAASRGIEALDGVAESLPFAANSFDHVLIVTTICFVDSPARMLAEAHRVLRPGGRLVIGFIDRDSTIGQGYLRQQADNVFYREATFYAAADVKGLLTAAAFRISDWGQTLTRPLAQTRDIEPLRPGVGRRAFVVVSAYK